MEPTPQDPLDPIVYPWSFTWTKTFKPTKLATIGKPLDKLTIEGKPKLLLRVRGNEKPLDVAEQRRNLRTQLLNAKATRLENTINDVLAQNEIEARYARQQAELKRLENLFQNGILESVLNNVSTLARQQFQSEYFNGDPDVSSFDTETKTIMELTQKIQRNTEELDGIRSAVNRQLQQIENEIRDDISVSTTTEQLEALSEVNSELSQLRQETESQLTPEPFDIAEEVIGEQQLLERVDQLEEQQQQLEFIQERVDDLEARTPVAGTSLRREETIREVEQLISQGQLEVQRIQERFGDVILPRNVQDAVDYFSTPRSIGSRTAPQNRINILREFLRNPVGQQRLRFD